MFKSDSYVRDKWIGSYLCSSFTSEQVTLGLIFYFIKHSRPLTVPHLSQKVALELASLVVNALTTACCRYINFMRVRGFSSLRQNAENIFFMWLRQYRSVRFPSPEIIGRFAFSFCHTSKDPKGSADRSLWSRRFFFYVRILVYTYAQSLCSSAGMRFRLLIYTKKCPAKLSDIHNSFVLWYAKT